MVVKTVVHFEIPAGDPTVLSKFYGDVFGWKFRAIPMGDMTYYLSNTGPPGKTMDVGMYKRMADETPRNFVQIDEIDSAIVRFTDAGGKEMMGKQEVPNVGWTYIGTDPEGNVIGLFQAKPAPRRAPARRKAAKPKHKTSKKR
jgi:uncharacterized protein